MGAGRIPPVRKRPTADVSLRAIGEAASRWKLRDGLTQPAIAEKFGKSPDKDTGAAYLNAERDCGAAGLLTAMYEDEAFANDVLAAVLNRRLCPVEVEPDADHDVTARMAAKWLATLLDELAVDDDRDGDRIDRRGAVILSDMLRELEPRFGAIHARAAHIRAGGR